MAIATLKVKGMSCDHCVRAVTQALRNTTGVRDATVDLKAGRAQVEYDENETSPRALAGVVMDKGYSAEEMV